MDNVPHFNWRAVITPTDDTTDATIIALDRHFNKFVVSKICPGCDRQLLTEDDGEEIIYGSFTWGMIHGHGFCSHCGWPAVVHHSIKDDDGNEVMFLKDFGLVTHPDFVRRCDEEESA